MGCLLLPLHLSIVGHEVVDFASKSCSRSLAFGDSLVLLFASKETAGASSADLRKHLVSPDAGVVLSSEGVAPLFQTGGGGGSSSLKNPSSVVFASADR